MRATSWCCMEPSQQCLLLLQPSVLLPALTCSRQAVMLRQITDLPEQQTKQMLSSSTALWYLLAHSMSQRQPLTTTVLPGDAGPQGGDRTGHTLSPAGSISFFSEEWQESFKLCCATYPTGQNRDMAAQLTSTNMNIGIWSHTRTIKSSHESRKYYLKHVKQTYLLLFS